MSSTVRDGRWSPYAIESAGGWRPFWVRSRTSCFRTSLELAALVRTRPVNKVERESGIKKYVTFLSVTPRGSAALPLVSEEEGLEAFALAGREVLVISRRKPNGSTGSRMASSRRRSG